MNKENNNDKKPAKEKSGGEINGIQLAMVLIGIILLGIGIIFFIIPSNAEDSEGLCSFDKEYLKLYKEYLKLWECKKHFCESQGLGSYYPNKEECRNPPSHPTDEIHCLIAMEGYSNGVYEKKIFYLNDVEKFCGVNI